MRFLQIIPCAIALAAASSTAALSQTVYNYTLNVPVSITNSPAGGWAQVSCFLQSGANGGGRELGSGSSPHETLTNGSFSGTVAVTVSSPTKPASYGCVVVVVGNNSQTLNIMNLTPTTALAPGWTGTPGATGNLP